MVDKGEGISQRSAKHDLRRGDVAVLVGFDGIGSVAVRERSTVRRGELIMLACDYHAVAPRHWFTIRYSFDHAKGFIP